MMPYAGIPKVAAKLRFESHLDEISNEERVVLCLWSMERENADNISSPIFSVPHFLLEEGWGMFPKKPGNNLSLKK